MVGLEIILLYVGRFLLGVAFVVFGIRNLRAIPRLTETIEKKGLLPMPGLWMAAGVGIQIVGGLMIATGLLAWLGALALAAFVLLAAYLFHPFWEYPTAERAPHISAFIMNTGLFGAFLMVAAISI
jgi:putative oxidoreductase